MGPTDAGFDGEKGLTLPLSTEDFVYKLRRGKTPLQLDKYNYKNQLLWYYPDNEEPVLYYCNQENQLFKLDFIPVQE